MLDKGQKSLYYKLENRQKSLFRKEGWYVYFNGIS